MPIDCGMRSHDPAASAPGSRLLAAALPVLLSLAAVASAQIGYAPDTIVDQLADYSVSPADAGFVSASGFSFDVAESLDTAVAVMGEGALTDANARFIGALIGAASGYGPDIAAPVTDFFRSRSAEMVDRGEVAVQVQEYLMYVTVSEGEPRSVSMRFEPQAVPADTFGAPAHTLGPADARHVIREFTDLQCPFCASFALNGQPIVEELVAGGEVRFEVHHFPLKSIHPNATVAAEASECVAAEAAAGGDQAGEDAFWVFTGALYAEQSRWVSLPDPLPVFTAIATEQGLGTDGLAMCIRTGRFSADIEEAYRHATQDIGLTGTPSIFVDGLKVGDYLDREEYERLMRLSRALTAVGEDGGTTE